MMYMICVDNKDDIVSIGGHAYKYPKSDDYKVKQVNEWPDDHGTPGKYKIDKTKVKWDKDEQKVKLKE